MVTTSLYGGLANQYFMVANCIAYALRNKMDYVIPTTGTNLGKITNYKFPNQKDVSISKRFCQLGHYYTPIPYYPHVHLHGHFQSEKYFKDYKKEIREILGFPEPSIDKCAIHVRRGDYLTQPNRFPLLPMEYYQNAMSDEFFVYWSDGFVIFTDDPGYCKIHFQGIEIISGDPIEDLKYMASFKYQIIANSSYSLFAALINDKTAISPHTDNWFGKDLKMHNLKDLLPDHFIKIKI